MRIEIMRSNELESSQWSGGTTSQLLIYPENAKYQDRDFLWRLSSASVEVDESVFTSLPGISRILMVIDGELRIEHEGHHSINLSSFQQDSFMGDWSTKSFGRVTDFNLMMANGCSGRVDAIFINECQNVDVTSYDVKEEYDQISKIFYAVNGDFNLEVVVVIVLLIFTKEML
jgi:uncharacterized protein